jgi:hypothetical protein
VWKSEDWHGHVISLQVHIITFIWSLNSKIQKNSGQNWFNPDTCVNLISYSKLLSVTIYCSLFSCIFFQHQIKLKLCNNVFSPEKNP